MSAPSKMTPEERVLAKRWAETWKETGPILERLRREELQKVSTVQAMQDLAGAFESAAFSHPPRLTSGLVEQQALFQRLRKSSDDTNKKSGS